MDSSDRLVVRLLVLAVLWGASPRQGFACPFCTAPSLTLAEQIEQAVSVELLELESRQPATGDDPSTPAVGRFRVIDELTRQTTTDGRQPASEVDRSDVSRRSRVLRTKESTRRELQLAADAQPGDLFVLIRQKTSETETFDRDDDLPLAASRAVWSYLKSLPPTADATPDRLRYFVRYLEHSEVMIAEDAYGEFANARYDEIVAMRDSLPRHRLRQWIIDSCSDRSEIQKRRGLYGMLLGLCGEPSDAALLKRIIVDDWKPDGDFRLGIDGMIGGYLLLTGENGLEIIERTKLAKPDVAFAETYAAMQALRFAWTYGDGVVSQDRLKRAMRRLLDCPALADLVITDLARWQDWDVQPRLIEMYDEDVYPSVKRAIVRFLLVSSRSAGRQPADKGQSAPKSSVPASGRVTRPNASESSGEREDASQPGAAADAEPAHVTQSRRYLAIWREQDPEIVSDAERFFVVE